jgi:integrase/recombinase XerC
MEPTITSVVLRYVSARRAAREIEPATANAYRTVLLDFAERIGIRRPLSSIERADIETWFATRIDGVQDSTLRYYYATVRNFFDWCVASDLIDRSPCAGIKGPDKPDSLPRSMTATDVARVMFACSDSRERLILSMMHNEGLRCVEVARLTFQDVELGEGVMRVIGKGKRERWLPITMATQDAIRGYLAEHPGTGTGPLIRTYRTPAEGPMNANYVSRLVSRVMTASGVKKDKRDGVSAHALRHTCLTELLEAGADIEDVRAVAGHATLQSTSIYLKRRRADDRLRSVMERGVTA